MLSKKFIIIIIGLVVLLIFGTKMCQKDNKKQSTNYHSTF